MVKNAFETVSDCFRSVEIAVEAADELLRAYAEGVGHPEYFNPHDLAKNPQQIAMDLAGLYAADTAANIIVANRGLLNFDGKIDEVDYINALVDIRDSDLDIGERYIAKNIANATWRAGQPFRDIATNPLNRITRDVNVQFNLLPLDEEDKDLVQLKNGAEFLLSKIGKDY